MEDRGDCFMNIDDHTSVLHIFIFFTTLPRSHTLTGGSSCSLRNLLQLVWIHIGMFELQRLPVHQERRFILQWQINLQIKAAWCMSQCFLNAPN